MCARGRNPGQTSHAAGGLGPTRVRATDEVPPLPGAQGRSNVGAGLIFPASDGTLPLPGGKHGTAKGINAEAANLEYFVPFPGLADPMEPDNPGMHAYNTVDHGVVLLGEIDLRLADRVVARLTPCDGYVQNGRRHTCRNPHDVDRIIAAVSVGATAGQYGNLKRKTAGHFSERKEA